MPKPCGVCAHMRRAEIDERLAQQVVNVSAVAREFGLGRRSVERHRERHLPEFLRAFAGRAQPLDYTALQAEAERLYLVTLDALAQAQAGVLVAVNDDGTQVRKVSNTSIARLISEARKGLDQLGKLAAVGADGESARTPTSNVELDARIAEALLRVERRQLGAGETSDVVDVDVVEDGAGEGGTPGPGAGSAGGGFARGGGSIFSDTPTNGSEANTRLYGHGPAKDTPLHREGPPVGTEDDEPRHPPEVGATDAGSHTDLTPERELEVRYPVYTGNPAASEDERRAEGYGPNPVTDLRPSPKDAV